MKNNKLYKSKFFKNDNLPFLETRFVKNSPYHYKEHFHETLSIGVVEDTSISYTHNNRQYLLEENQLAVINPNEMHSCNPCQNESRTYHMLYIDKNWCEELQKSIFLNISGYINILDVHIENKDLYQSFLTLNYNLLDENIFYIEKEELLISFFIELFSRYCSKELASINIKKENKKIKKALDYIDQQIDDNLTLEDISNHLNISSYYLIRLFKLNLHQTPHSYLLNKKVLKAKKLLTTNQDISQIAYTLGFFDQSHLNRIFKQYTASTPLEYRNGIR